MHRSDHGTELHSGPRADLGSTPRADSRANHRSEESDFQRGILLALGTRHDVRLWRQNVGAVPIRDEMGQVTRVFRAGPPKGAADLSGIVRPEGWRLEIEVKGSRGRTSPEQARWGAFIRTAGGIYLFAAYNAHATLSENVRRLVSELDAALSTRRRSR